MNEVTQKEFYAVIGPMNVTCKPIGDFPYTSLFKDRGGVLKGKVIDSYTDGVKHKHPIVSTYYLIK